MTMSRSAVRVIDPVLSKVALGYKDPDFAGQHLFPLIDGVPSGAKVIKFGKEAFLKYNMRRAPGAKTGDVQFGYSSDPVALVQDSLNGKVPREWLRDSQAIPNVDHGSRAVRSVMRVMHRQLEIDQAELAQDAAQYDASHKITLAKAWTDPTADLRADVNAGKAAVRASIGAEPNVLEIPYAAFQGAAENTLVKEQFKYTSSESLTEAMLAKFLGLDKVVVGKGTYAESEDSDFTDIWSKGVLAYVPPNAESIEEPSFGYTYVGEGQPLVEESWYDKDTKSFKYPVEYERRPYQTSMKAGYLLDGIQ